MREAINFQDVGDVALSEAMGVVCGYAPKQVTDRMSERDAYQILIDSGFAWHVNEPIGRVAAGLIELGECETWPRRV